MNHDWTDLMESILITKSKQDTVPESAQFLKDLQNKDPIDKSGHICDVEYRYEIWPHGRSGHERVELASVTSWGLSVRDPSGGISEICGCHRVSYRTPIPAQLPCRLIRICYQKAINQNFRSYLTLNYVYALCWKLAKDRFLGNIADLFSKFHTH